MENLRAERVLLEEDLSPYKVMQIKKLGIAAGWTPERAHEFAMGIYYERLKQSKGRPAE